MTLIQVRPGWFAWTVSDLLSREEADLIIRVDPVLYGSVRTTLAQDRQNMPTFSPAQDEASHTPGALQPESQGH